MSGALTEAELSGIPAARLMADRDRALALVPVSRETLDRLDRLVALLLRWQRVTNLIAPSTVPELWTRHVADSLQLVALAPQALIWVDLGSGGGFPGLAIACALAGTPGTMVNLVESHGKKAAFLREAARNLDVPAAVYHGRIEDFARTFVGTPDVVTARALAPLDRLLDYAEPLLKRGAQALFPKGQDVDAELTQASKCWNIEAGLISSKTDPAGRVVVVRSAARRAQPRADALFPLARNPDREP